MDFEQLLRGLLDGDRRSLAKAITLIESQLPRERVLARQLIDRIIDRRCSSVRIGISGIPGVGKSSFIEAFGSLILQDQHRMAILAVDPSSPQHGGSILGDRTRMTKLSSHRDVFIRPSPTSGALGGVARRTREAVLVCEAAGYDTIVVETVGVGQSEVMVASMVDILLTLHMPGSGDELQGIKKGILELVDIIAVTKADGDQIIAAKNARQQLDQALSLTRTSGESRPPVLLCSSVTGTGLQEVQKSIEGYVAHAQKTGAFAKRRREQSRQWYYNEIDNQLHERLRQDVHLSAYRSELETAVLEERLSASQAATLLIDKLVGSSASMMSQ